jgi:ABC-type uncharacterized transport system involved in gliding motility auxiliary subunit
MRVTRRSRMLVRLQNILFVVLFLAVLGVAAWISTRYSYEADWTYGQRNTLTEASRDIVQSLDGPVTVTAFLRDDEVRRRNVESVVERYRRFKDDIQLEFVNPDTSPDRARSAGVTADGEVLVAFAGRSERLATLDERSLTNALVRIGRDGERWIVYMGGHGERQPLGEANHDHGMFGAELQRQGLSVRGFNPLAQGAIPDNTDLLVIAGPSVEMLPGAVVALVEYVERGGNLLWLQDPGPLHGLEPLAEHLGISFPPGVVVDTTAQMFGVDDARVVLVAEYTQHPVTRELATMTLFPVVNAVDYEFVPDPWRVNALLTTLTRSWLETGELAGHISMDEAAGDIPGPLDIGITLTRERDGGEQRIAIVGDGDFLSNAFLGNGSNLDLGLKLVNWLTGDDPQVAVHLRSAPDITLDLSNREFYAISFGFLIALPLALIAAGVLIWIRRRRR